MTRAMRLFALLVVCACGGGSDSGSLRIDAVTDLVPGVEFDTVLVELERAAPSTTRWTVSQTWETGTRVAQIESLAPGTYTGTVSLAYMSDIVLSRPFTVAIRDDVADTIILDRSCVGVECPDATGPAAIACLGGRCVDPACLDGTQPACPPTPVCTVAAECTARDGCVTATCAGAACLGLNACGADEYCSPTSGVCEPNPPPDGLMCPTALADPFFTDRLVTDDWLAAECECDFADRGFPSVEACVLVETNDAEVMDCYASVSATLDASVDYLGCFAAFTSSRAGCIRASTCDPAEVDACDMRDEEIRCCDSPTSEEFDAAMAAADLVRDCLTGGADACPVSTSVAVGAAVFTGSTVGAGNDFEDGCASDAPDHSLMWTAPTAGDWIIDTAGSSFDTQIAVYQDCAAAVVRDCDTGLVEDTTLPDGTTDVRVTLAADETVVIVVGGNHGAAAGSYVVNINAAP